MDPIYRNSYQNQSHHHMDYNPSCYPRPEAVPPFMYPNPTLNNNQYWPWGTGYPYPPVACHGCCTHNAWRPNYSPIPPLHYPPFPTQYAPPHFVYPRDQHCCGCPNHLCSQKEQPSVRIEEEPEIAPDKFKTTTHPIISFPHDTKEHQRDSKQVSADAKHNSEWKQPLGWFGWYPSEWNRYGSPKEKGGGQELNDGKGRFPFPAYWMPYMPEEKEEEPTNKHSVDPKPSLEPVKDAGEKAVGQPRSVVKYIPVKELKPHEETPTTHTNKESRDSSVEDVTGTKEKLTKNDPKAKSSSPPKSSKLPPVCLRVDPLPRRKDTTRSSRSSTPAEDKKTPEQVSSEVRKAPSPDAPKEKPAHTTNKEPMKCKGVTKEMKLVDGNEESSKIQIQTEEKHEKGRIPAECRDDVTIAKEEANTLKKPKLSEEDAAVIIQTAYRGYVVRRWEPVKKLKEIAGVREQIAQVRKLIQALESSSDIQEGSKQRNIIAETIMSLLLKLDTIQVVDPSIREVRKSVVRELVCLQEKLDALIDKKLKALQTTELVSARRDENVLKESADVTPSHDSNKTKSDLVEPCENQFDGVLDLDSEMEEILVTSKLDNEASEVSESCMPGNFGPVVEPTKLKDEPSSQSAESSPTKEDGTDLGLGCGTECSVHEVVDSLSNKEKTKSEQPLEEVGGNLLMLSDAERGELDQAKQPYGGMEETHISETNHDTSKGERECTESIDELGISLGENHNTKLDATEIANSVDGLLEEGCTSFEELETTKQADSGCKPDECSAQSPVSIFSDIFKSADIADEKDNPIAEVAPTAEDANSNTPEAGSPVMEKAPDMLPVKEHEAVQEPIADIDEKVDDDTSTDIKGSDQCSVEQRQEDEYELEVLNEEKRTAQKQEHFLLHIGEEECVEGEGANEEEHTPEIKSVAAANVNQGKPASRDGEKIIEENENLRDMVEKLVISGQEQLRVISSLSGRIKHLERNLSKKRKLKVKPQKGKKTSFSETVECEVGVKGHRE